MNKKQEFKYKYVVRIFDDSSVLHFNATHKKLCLNDFDEFFEKNNRIRNNSIMIKIFELSKDLAKNLNKKYKEIIKDISSEKDDNKYFLIKYVVYFDNNKERFKYIKYNYYEEEAKKNNIRLFADDDGSCEIDFSTFLEMKDEYKNGYTNWHDFKYDNSQGSAYDYMDLNEINIYDIRVKFFPSEKSAKLFVTEMNKIIDKYDIE